MSDIVTEYKKLVEESGGFSAVHIADLRDRMEIDQEAMEWGLRNMAREGLAVMSSGDWSLSDGHVRSGVIEYPGVSDWDGPKKMTLVTLKLEKF